MAYADGSDLTARYDIDLIGDLASDERETLDRPSVASHPHVAVALEDAAGEIEAALLAGGRYTIEQLQSLTGPALSHLKAINCGLAMVALHDRRPEAVEESTIERLTKRSMEALRALKRGENVFGLAEHVEAGRTLIGGPSAIDIRNTNGLASRMARRYFPDTQSRLPRGQ